MTAQRPDLHLLSKELRRSVSTRRDGKFPRSRIVGGKSMWRSDEIKAWLDGLPLRPLKGDDESVVV
jgi:hypothetical protein